MVNAKEKHPQSNEPLPEWRVYDVRAGIQERGNVPLTESGIGLVWPLALVAVVDEGPAILHVVRLIKHKGVGRSQIPQPERRSDEGNQQGCPPIPECQPSWRVEEPGREVVENTAARDRCGGFFGECFGESVGLFGGCAGLPAARVAFIGMAPERGLGLRSVCEVTGVIEMSRGWGL